MLLGLHMSVDAQQEQPALFKNGLKLTFKDDSVRYVKVGVLGQFWARYNSNNPGSTLYGDPVSDAFDIGIRRARVSVLSQFTPTTFFYMQAGLNNLNSLSARKSGVFIHDLSVEQKLYKNYIVLGTGLTGWNGTSRYSSSAVGAILGTDLPTIQETTNDVTDQFGRKFGVFLKGQVSGLDYRFSVAKPFPVQNALSAVETLPANVQDIAYFSTKAPHMNYAGYVFWQFFEKESNQLPYMTGSYLGKKKILNVGAGFQHQKNAMWYRNSASDTVSSALQQFGIDVFYDSYLNKEKQNAVTAYVAYMKYNFGPNYIRNTGIFNVANGVNGSGSFNGAGNAMPAIGTGNVFYGQAAYLFRKNLLGKLGTLQPYAAVTVADYERLNNLMKVYNVGVNWLLAGHNSKLSLDYQSRPVFNRNGSGQLRESVAARRGQIVLQYQVSF